MLKMHAGAPHANWGIVRSKEAIDATYFIVFVSFGLSILLPARFAGDLRPVASQGQRRPDRILLSRDHSREAFYPAAPGLGRKTLCVGLLLRAQSPLSATAWQAEFAKRQIFSSWLGPEIVDRGLWIVDGRKGAALFIRDPRSSTKPPRNPKPPALKRNTRGRIQVTVPCATHPERSTFNIER